MKIKKYRHLVIAISIALTSCDQVNTEDQNSPSNNSERSSTMSQETCRNLHKVTDVDDLLKQLYDNIDSYCLFDMPTEELEKIWGIKVFSFSDDIFIQEKADERWDYDKTGDGLYVVKFEEKNLTYLQVFSTEIFSKHYSENYNIWGGMLGQGRMPNYLPHPIIPKSDIPHNYPILTTDRGNSENILNLQQIDSDFEKWTEYVWLNQDKSIQKPFLVISTPPDKPFIGIIVFYKDAENWTPYQKFYFNQ